MSIKIAVVQHETRSGAVEQNRAKALDFAAQALQKKPDIILFHEGVLVGYVDNVKELAEEITGPTITALQRLLKGKNTRILFGLNERCGDTCYISAVLVGSEGVIANYHKTHLWWKVQGVRHESEYYSPGAKLVTFDLKAHKCGVMICYDGDFGEMTRSYANLGCEILFWMNNRQSRGYEEVKALAGRNSIIMATSCCCGLDEQGRECGGGSNITGSDGTLITEIWTKEGIIFADVEPEGVLEERRNNQWFTGQRGDLYVY